MSSSHSVSDLFIPDFTCSRFVLIFLSVQCLAYSLASSVIRSDTSASPLEQAISSFLVPLPELTKSDRCASR